MYQMKVSEQTQNRKHNNA